MLPSRRFFQTLLAAIFFAAILPVSFLSCGSAHSGDEYYVFVSANLQVPYWQTAGAGFTKAAQEMKVRADFLGPQNYDPAAERATFDQAVQKQASGILLGVTDAALLKDSIDKAIAAGIPVITVDSDAPASKRLFFIGTNNYQAGFTGGQRLVKELNGKGGGSKDFAQGSLPDPAKASAFLAGAKSRLMSG